MNQHGVTVLVGTTKGAFTISSKSDRNGWSVKGPFCDGWPINHIIGDPATRVLWAGGGSDWHGAGVWRSEDMGATWNVAKLTKGQLDDWAASDPQLAAMVSWTNQPLRFADQFSQIWSLCYATARFMPEPNRQDCFRAGTAARTGKKWKVCETILPPTVGPLAAPDWYCIRSCLIRQMPKNSGSEFRRPASLRLRMEARPGIAAIAYRIKSQALNTLTPLHRATAKSDIASTT